MGVGLDEILIGYFGFLHPLKGGELLIRALAELAGERQAFSCCTWAGAQALRTRTRTRLLRRASNRWRASLACLKA